MAGHCVICEEFALHTVDGSPVCGYCNSLLTSHKTADIIQRFRIIETYNLRCFGLPWALFAQWSSFSVLLSLAIPVIDLFSDRVGEIDTWETRFRPYAAIAVPVVLTICFGIIFAILGALEKGNVTVIVHDGTLKAFHDMEKRPPVYSDCTFLNLKYCRVFWGRPDQFEPTWTMTRYVHAMNFRIAELSLRRFRCFVVCHRPIPFWFGETRLLVGVTPVSRARWRFLFDHALSSGAQRSSTND